MADYRLPAELWAIIFEYACTDTGATGRALSLTCVHFRELARRVRLQCVAVVGAHQIVTFEAYLRTLPPDERQVRHIFISSCPQTLSPDAPTAHTHVCRMPNSSGYYAVIEAYRSLLELVAPTLLTCYFSHSIARLSHLLPVSMPHLKSLVLHGPKPTWFVRSTQRFPELQRLIFAGFCDYAPESIDDLWAAAPAVECLYLALKYPTRHLVTDLRASLRRRPRDTHSLRWRVRAGVSGEESLSPMPGNVQLITIQVGERPPHGDLAICHMNVLRALQQLADEDPRLVIEEPKACIHHTDTELDWLANY
ncbi:hypothetical protein BD626DRAFT_403302 [Schizophyllum amplum]|uniref:F-box domain-containing protein n=1 Tax=Schizophyllum amplum TaxID=97359 RepID=A0A550CDM9_9AGAR|nr:hypothetical protein BD626DRAFT_403302 [Auriculariopsis ampla]